MLRRSLVVRPPRDAPHHSLCPRFSGGRRALPATGKSSTVLDRLAFVPTREDFRHVKRVGVERYIAEQLDPKGAR